MFTGLIEEVGEIIEVRASDSRTQLRPQVASKRNGSVLQIAASGIAKKARRGDSIAVNGCCLTLTSRRGDRLTFDLLKETIARTNLKRFAPKRSGESGARFAGRGTARRTFRAGPYRLRVPHCGVRQERRGFSIGSRVAGRICTVRGAQRFDRSQRNQPHRR